MKTMMKIATAAAVLVLAAGLLPSAQASCLSGSAAVTSIAPGGYISNVWTEDWFSGNDLSVYGFGFNNGVSYYFVVAPFAHLSANYPGDTLIAPVSPNYRGYWWILGTGDPTSSAGRGTPGSSPANSDSGAYLFPILQQAHLTGPGGGTVNYGGYLQADWQDSGVDNCPGEDVEGDAADLQYGSCLCVLLTDEFNGEGYAAVASAEIQTVAQGDTYLTRTTRGPNLTAAAPAGAPANIFDPIILRKLPKPRVTGASKLSNTQVQVSAQLDAVPAGGVYNKDGCDCSPTSYVVHARSFANATLDPASPDTEPNNVRDISGGGWAAVSGPHAVGGGTGAFTLNCAGDESIFLGTQLCYANGANPEFCTPVVSASSVEVECGTNLATPEPPGRGRGKATGRPDHARPERN